MSIIVDLYTVAMVAENVSGQFGTVESSRQMIKNLLRADQVSQEHN